MLAAVLFLTAAFFIDSWLFRSTAWVYFAFCFGYIDKYYFPKFDFRNDISYGVYILSWPLQQTVLHLGLAKTGLQLFAISIVPIIALAFLSWVLVEKPALKLKN